MALVPDQGDIQEWRGDLFWKSISAGVKSDCCPCDACVGLCRRRALSVVKKAQSGGHDRLTARR